MSDVKIRIDTRYFRICIHRQALKAIGEPAFLNFGYDPDTMRLLVVGSWVDDRKSVRVRYDNSGSVYVFSKPLLQGIRQVSHVLTARGSYIVEGEARSTDKVLIFPLAKAEKISES